MHLQTDVSADSARCTCRQVNRVYLYGDALLLDLSELDKILFFFPV